jgi:hypothetical protein
MSEPEQRRESTPPKKQGDSSLQELYNRRRELQRAVKDVERRIAEEKNRLKATSARDLN